MKDTRRYFELAVMGGCAFILTKALLSFVLAPSETPTEGNPEWRLILTISYFGVAIVLVSWYRESLLVLRRNWFLVILVLFALLSSVWADLPDLVFRKAIGVFGTTLLGVALAVRFSFRDQLRMLSWLFRVIAILSLACIVLLPSYGVSKEGEWQGIFEYKNALGSMMALSILVEWQRPAGTRISKILKISALLLSAVLLRFSDSVTPALAVVIALLLIEIYKLAVLRLRIPLYAFFLAFAIVVSAGAMLLAANSDSVAGAVGRSSNLTGRTEIWSAVVAVIPERPILGYGYSGFWLGASPESLAINHVMRGWVMYSHNGYLEMQLNLGVVGLLLTLILLGIATKRALTFSEQRQDGIAIWPLAFLFYFILHNLGECTILIQDIEWAVCVSCIAGTDAILLPANIQEEDAPSLVLIEEPT